ncbi:protein YeeZ [Impatiens glandulifera]|uniref:protein YeeZ n=1 Tax=Impatiens glandulifera TaxID=253017 RepID=UPI001FB1136D|nr:protein YeeZ [Impatiens glandulifera]
MEVSSLSGRFPAARIRLFDNPTKIQTTSSLTLKFQARNESSPNRVFILGLGFVGQFFAREMKNQGWEVSGSCTNSVKKKKLEDDMGLNIYLFNANEPEPEVIDVISHHTHLLISIPPILGAGDPTLQHEELLKSRFLGSNLRWMSYLSSTSVYGDCNGEWVDEEHELNPKSELAKARICAEKEWLKLGHDVGISTQIFRLGGIYGPGRSAVDTVMKQEQLSDTQKMRAHRSYTSRVHVADIYQTLEASMIKPSSGRVYNVVDDNPAPRAEVFSYAQDLIEEKWGKQLKIISKESSESRSLKSRGEKRVCNDRIKKELGVKLMYEDYRSGLKSIVEDMNDITFN